MSTATAQFTFKRYEIKYLLEEDRYQALRRALGDRITEDAYGLTDICNIYYDTPDFRLIRDSMDKPMYKEKLRLRSYGAAGEDTRVFAELKKKYDGVVYKRRVALPCAEAEAILPVEGGAVAPGFVSHETAGEEDGQRQIFREIGSFLRYYGTLRPAMYLSYKRIAAFGTEDPALRVTFDTDILWRTDNVTLQAAPAGRSVLEAGQHLMEIKVPGAFPLWLSEILTDLEIYPTSFSKYGRAYSMMRAQDCERLGVILAGRVAAANAKRRVAVA